MSEKLQRKRRRRASSEKQEPVLPPIQRLRKALKSMLINRDQEIDGVLTALLAKEHVLLLGMHGTAKSALTESVCRSIEGTKYFSWLMSKFTVPEELFGTFSLKALQDDRFERVTHGKMPEADIVFLDEIFKANSAILNNLLTIINERKFANGTSMIKVPLQTVVGASNELPEGAELAALYDRFLLRFWVEPLSSRSHRRRLLQLDTSRIKKALQFGKITIAELQQEQEEVLEVEIKDRIGVILDIQEALQREGHVASDRRWRKSLIILKAYAHLQGSDRVKNEHMPILANVLWDKPEDRDSILALIQKVAIPERAKVDRILNLAREQVAELPIGSRDIPEEKKGAYFGQATRINADLKDQIEELQKMDAKYSLDAVDELMALQVTVKEFAAQVSGFSI